MSKTVLIVDDSSAVRQAISITLQNSGYEVIEGYDGKHALSQLSGQRVHLIVSDLNMPVMDGLSFVHEVKKLPEYKFTPIIMLTTESSEATENIGRGAGVTAWLVKPLRPYHLLQAVSKLVQA